MNRHQHKRFKPMLLLSAVLLLRAAVPAGYMPAAADSGLLFHLCPEGLPSGLMQTLAGDAGHQHGHGNHGQENQGEPGSDDHYCPVGQMLLSAALVDNACLVETVPVAPVLAIIPRYAYTNVSSTYYHSRGPPA